MAQVPYNKLLTNLANSSRIEEYWPSVVFVRTATTSGQYSPVRPSRSVSKRLLLHDSGSQRANNQNQLIKMLYCRFNIL